VAAGGFSSTSVARNSEGKKEGGPTGAGAWQRDKEERGPGCGGRSTRQPATAPGRRARAATLSRNRGERLGTGDVVRARLIGGAGMSRDES
jgi:hypothetical protein